MDRHATVGKWMIDCVFDDALTFIRLALDVPPALEVHCLRVLRHYNVSHYFTGLQRNS